MLFGLGTASGTWGETEHPSERERGGLVGQNVEGVTFLTKLASGGGL